MFEIQPGLMIWTILVFLVLLFVLSKILLPTILNTLKEREEGIQKAIDDAENARIKAEEIMKENQEKLDNAQKEINEIIANGRKQADSIVQKATEEANQVKKQKLDDATKEIEIQKEKAISDIRKEVADLVIMATEKVLNEKLDKDKHQGIIEEHISNLNKN